MSAPAKARFFVRFGVAEVVAWTLAAGLCAAAVAWPAASGLPDRAATERQAAEVLRRVADAQGGFAAEHGRFAPIAPQRQATLLDLPDLELPPEAARFSVDAIPGERGDSLALRVSTRPEAVREGRAAPVLVRAEVALPTPPGMPAALPRVSAAAVLRAP